MFVLKNNQLGYEPSEESTKYRSLLSMNIFGDSSSEIEKQVEFKLRTTSLNIFLNMEDIMRSLRQDDSF